ncbi:MAG: ComEC/Rec2 family competence protein [Devosia sp.]|nr:ComEC/Rec2 family competence protein [Devosia sp.]
MAQQGEIALADRERLPAPAAAKQALPAAWQPPRAHGWLDGVGAAFTEAFEHRRAFLLLPYAMIAGLVVAFTWPADPSPVLLMAGGLATVAGLVTSRNAAGWNRAAGLAAAFWIGFSLLSIHGALVGTQMLARPAYGTYEARIDEVLTANADGVRAIVSGIVALDGARALPVRRARLVIDGIPDLAPGDTIRSRVRFYPVPGPVVPNGFDTQFHAHFDGIGAYGNTIGTAERIASGDAAAPERIVDAIRRSIAAKVDAVLPQPSAGVARALITGDQSAVTEESREMMATAGLAHVLSVSGLHLTLVAMLVMATLRGGLALAGGLDRFVSVKRVAAVGAILAALGYFAISGGNVAAQRATLMILLVLGAVVAGRRALTMRNVAIAALLIIVVDPASVFRPSFQLSFAAVVALIGAWEMFRPGEGRERGAVGKVVAYFGGGALTSVVAGAATLLFSIYHFQQTAPLSVLGNLMSLVLIGFVMMPAALAATVLMPLGLEAPFLLVMGWSIDVMIWVATIVAGWSAGISASPLLLPLALLLGLLALAWFTFLTSWHRLVAPLLLVPAVWLLALDRPPDVLVSDTTQAIAMRGEDGLALVAGKPDSFAVKVWRETYAEPLAPAPLLRCDSIGCFGHSAAGFSLAIATDPAAFHEDCGLADLMILRRPAPQTCAGSLVIDADALERGGIHWLRWDEAAEAFEVRPAVPPGDRPWRVPH